MSNESRLEQSFFAIRSPWMPLRGLFKEEMKKRGLNIIATHICWLTLTDLRILYQCEGHIAGAVIFMAQTPIEVGVVQGKNVVQRLLTVTGRTYRGPQCQPGSFNYDFGWREPVWFDIPNGAPFDYYVNPVHRSKRLKGAHREVEHFYKVLQKKSPDQDANQTKIGLMPSFRFKTKKEQSSYTVLPGWYKHYKGGRYQVIGVATNRYSNKQEVVLQNPMGNLETRDLNLFMQMADWEGKLVPRFQLID